MARRILSPHIACETEATNEFTRPHARNRLFAVNQTVVYFLGCLRVPKAARVVN